MQLPIYQVDAFTNRRFAGNPAAVCPLERWLDDDMLQAIAAENNLSETAFFVAQGERYALRWFTPTCEVDLCGHATLATAFVIFNELDGRQDELRFHTASGELIVRRDAENLIMDFPAGHPQPVNPTRALTEAFAPLKPAEVLRDADYLVIVASEREVREFKPNTAALMKLDARGVCVSAPGDEVDFVSRCFFPAAGILEDPVTGSAHCQLAPYWAQRLGKNTLHARQISARGGELQCTVDGERVILAGQAVAYLKGEIEV